VNRVSYNKKTVFLREAYCINSKGKKYQESSKGISEGVIIFSYITLFSTSTSLMRPFPIGCGLPFDYSNHLR
jgi:hypothetical protein